MPGLARVFNWGDKIRSLSIDLYNQLSKSHTDIVDVLNTKASRVVVDGSDPPASNQFNVNYDIGDIYVRSDTDTAWIMTSRTSSEAVTWTQIT